MHSRGLYAITDAGLLPGESLFPGVTACLRGGARMIQYRNKTPSPAIRREEASELLKICRGFSVPLIINDDVALAMEIGADGVHLGRDDGEVHTARAVLGQDRIIGVSCYNEWSRARIAAEAGADYLAFGRFFASRTKPGDIFAGEALLRKAKQELDVPIVAIGGITAANAAPLITAGADGVAVIHGVFGQTDIEAAARDIARLFPA